jgi:hypothetical protein
MLTNGSTPFTEDGFAAVIADLRRLYLLVGGGSNDLNNASTDVTQDATSAGENANNAFKLRGVNLDTTAPTDQQVLTYIKATKSYAPRALTGISTVSTGAALISTNNLSDVSNTATAATNIGVGSNSAVTHASLSTTSGISVGGALSVGSGASITKDLAVSSGTRLLGGVRLSPSIMTSSTSVSTSDCFIITSGAITITLPSAATHRVYFIACDTGAASTVSALDGSQNIRGATGVALVQGRIHTFMSDGSVTWYETRSA